MATLVTDQWKGTYSSYSRYFRGWMEYTASETNNACTITITSYGVEKITSGKTTWEGSTGTVEVSASIGSGENIQPVSDLIHSTTKSFSSSNLIDFGAGENSKYTFWSGTLTHTFTKTTRTQLVRLYLDAEKASGAWHGYGVGSIGFTIPIRKVTVTYNGNGGAASRTADTVTYGTSVTLPTASRGGYNFQGWGNSSSGSAIYSGGGSLTITSNRTLYAVWQPKTYTLTINPQGGTYNSTTSNSTKTMTYHSSSNNNIGTPSRTGYTFGGWYTETNGGGTLVFNSSGSYNTSAGAYWASGGYWNYTGAVTVYAKWIIKSYTLTANANNGSIPSTSGWTGTGGTATKTLTHGSQYGTLPTPTRTGYDFNSWNTAADGTGSTVATTNTISASTTIYAKWTEKTATLAYNAAGLSGATVPSNVTMKYTTATSLTAGTAPSGYTFYGWATSDANAKAGTRAYTGTQQYKATNTIPTGATLYAIWYGTLSYNANGHGTAPGSQTMYYTGATNAAAAISATGYTFNGWNTNSGGTGTLYAAGAQVKAANAYKATTTLYAKWTAINYPITYTLNSGSQSNPKTSYTIEDATFTLVNPTRTGYVFAGWTGSNGTTKQTSVSIAKGSTGDKSYTANWTAETYPVTFNANGGTTPTASKTITFGSTYGTLPTPTWTNHTFVGWFDTSAATGGTQYTSSTSVTTSSARTLYARWTGNKVGPGFALVPTTERCTNTGTYDGEAAYCRVTVKAIDGYTYANTSNTTTASSTTVTINYKKSTDSSYSSAYLKTVTISNGTESLSGSATRPTTITANTATTYCLTNSSGTPISLDTTATYNIQIILTSNGLTNTTVPLLSAAIFPLDFNEDGSAIGIFKVAPNKTANTPGLYVGKQATFENYITIGSSSQSTAPSGAIKVHDLRNYGIPVTMIPHGVNFFFSNNTMPNSNWWSGIHINGWEGDYSAWELVGPSHSADNRTTPLYVRSGRTTNGWGSWRQLYDSSNLPPVNSILNNLPTWTADPTDNTYFIRQDTAGAASYGKVLFSTLWNYISTKLNDGSYTNKSFIAKHTTIDLKSSTNGVSGQTSMYYGSRDKNNTTFCIFQTNAYADGQVGTMVGARNQKSDASLPSWTLFEVKQDKTGAGSGNLNALLRITLNSNTFTIGSQNSSYTHLYNSASIPFIFNNSVLTTTGNLGSTSYPFNNLYIGKANGAGIYYAGSHNTYRMIRFIDGTDEYGNGISIGGGGLAAFGSGESADTILSNLSLTASGGTEATYITSDGNIELYPGQNSYDAAAHHSITNNGIWAGVSGNTTREIDMGVRSGAGTMFMYSAAATNGNRGIWLQAHGTGAAKNVFVVDTNNNVTFNGTLSGNCTGSSGSCTGNAATATNSSQLNGYASDTSATNNTIARRTANGYLFATYLNQSSGAETPTTSSYIMYANSDGYLRKSSLANIKTILGLGTVSRKTSTVTSIANDTAVELCNLALTAGTWILVGKCRIEGKAGNVRRFVICTTSKEISFATMAKTDGTGTGIQHAPGTATVATQYQVTHIVQITSNTTFYFNAWHNAGSALGINVAQLEAVRIA